ncbi:DoxX family membrane protein [Corynebacterium atypicum]|uniref:DoxX family membrane protein n=1 Tax=Corynebacterium atypicum TaxID=191610 RepID=UPI00068BD004|nr:DoxX family membrane protein [Corynebacterium atypicum]
MSPDKNHGKDVPFDENFDGMDLPTYQPSSVEEPARPRRRPRRADPYARMGRAAPQSIAPRSDAAEEASQDRPSVPAAPAREEEAKPRVSEREAEKTAQADQPKEKAAKESSDASAQAVTNQESASQPAKEEKVASRDAHDRAASDRDTPDRRETEMPEKPATARATRLGREDKAADKRSQPLDSDAPTEVTSRPRAAATGASSARRVDPAGRTDAPDATEEPPIVPAAQPTERLERPEKEKPDARRQPRPVAEARIPRREAAETEYLNEAAGAPVRSPAAAIEPLAPEVQDEDERAETPDFAGYRGVDDDEPSSTEAPVVDDRRGTLNFGLLILRVVLGAFLILHSVGIFFRLGNSEGLTGLALEYVSYPWAQVLSIAVPAAELAAGVFLLLGLITPVFAAVGIVSVGFSVLHNIGQAGSGLNLFEWTPEAWLALVVLGGVAAIQFTGPGTWSVDYPRGWARRPLASSWIGVIVALAVLALVWWFGAATNPF